MSLEFERQFHPNRERALVEDCLRGEGGDMIRGRVGLDIRQGILRDKSLTNEAQGSIVPVDCCWMARMRQYPYSDFFWETEARKKTAKMSGRIARWAVIYVDLF